MKNLDGLSAFPPETIDAILQRADIGVILAHADEVIGELIREELAANRAWHRSREGRATADEVREWITQAREWSLSNATA